MFARFNASAKERLLCDLRTGGITDERVLGAVACVPRDAFVPSTLKSRAYENIALPIGEQQTISQPMVVAHMAQAVRPSREEHVLEIGTGSGYGAAVLAQLAADVVSVEIRATLAQRAARVLQRLGCRNVRVILGDGSMGWIDLAPYDAIVVTAASPSLPPALLNQLAQDGGRLVAPVGSIDEQQLVLTRRDGDQFSSRKIGGVRFVPLRGAAGFPLLDPSRRN
ncbi:MAG TPA: protein-L-isoaspartate(D-aspartate) O-methyltransferase [Chloroflexota bacterium]|nr:protein-L-isoaspartate(D-aspartate) O-methyltransferase [Chloroflexota bacterium]